MCLPGCGVGLGGVPKYMKFRMLSIHLTYMKTHVDLPHDIKLLNENKKSIFSKFKMVAKGK